MIQYRIPLTGLKFSTNKIYAGIHWSKRREIKDSILDYAGAFCRPVKKFGPYPIQICYRFFFTSKPLDTTNCTFLVKMFEDALVSLKILEDDSPQYVARSIIEVVMVPKRKGKKTSYDLGEKEDKKSEDYLEIIATSCNYLSFDT